jgi:Leucine-rich repeat (LRR) protein
LDLAETNCTDLSSLASLTELAFLDITGSQVSDLSPIASLPKLKRIGADQTKLSSDDATLFVQSHPDVLLIHHVKDLESWWESLSSAWKQVLIKANPALGTAQPKVENLTQTLKLTQLNLDGAGIETLGPVVRFVSLSSISFSNNPFVIDLLPLTEVKTLKEVVGKNTGVQDLAVLKENSLLERIDVESSPIRSIQELTVLPKLRYLNVNASLIDEIGLPAFHLQRPDVMVIYRSESLTDWWEGLDEAWKKVLLEKIKISGEPNTDQLHQLTSLAYLELKGVLFIDLEPLTIFNNLRKLVLFDAPTLELGPLRELTKLTSLKLSQLPAVDYLPISGLTELEELDLSNTGIEELIALSKLTKLKKLNLSGTNIKSLKGIEPLTNLEELDVASTDLRSLKALDGMRALKKLTCFNTRLTPRGVDSFKESFPKCEVRFY